MFYCKHSTTVDGGWGTWTSFTTCSHSCGGGLQSRVRKCDSPSPANGGRLCYGDGVETQACNTAACPCQGSNCPGKQFHEYDCTSIIKKRKYGVCPPECLFTGFSKGSIFLTAQKEITSQTDLILSQFVFSED